MKEINYWDRFLMTGSVSDFLSYKNAQEDAGYEEALNCTRKNEAGGKNHAGVCRDYRDDFKSGTNWGI